MRLKITVTDKMATEGWVESNCPIDRALLKLKDITFCGTGIRRLWFTYNNKKYTAVLPVKAQNFTLKVDRNDSRAKKKKIKGITFFIDAELHSGA